MRKAKVMRLTLDMLTIVFLLGFILALFWYRSGSLEMVPTEEQQGKAQIGAIISMLVTGIPCIACVVVRIKLAHT